MKVGELIRELQEFYPDLEVHLHADPEGISTPQPSSLSYQEGPMRRTVVLISAWDDEDYSVIV